MASLVTSCTVFTSPVTGMLAVIEFGTTSNHTSDYCLVYDYYGTLPTSCPTSPPTGTTGNNGNVRGYRYQDSVNASSFPHKAIYTYDGANRLLTATAMTMSGSTIWSQSYNYDQWGNWTCSGSGVCPILTWNAQNNQLLTIGGNNPSYFSYDAAGNMTYDPSNYNAHSYQWDAEGRVSTVDGGSSWTLTYNALGHRVQWAYTGGAYQFLYDPAGNWLGLGNAGGYTLVRFGDRHLLVYRSSETQFHHINNLGSTSMMTDHAGNPVEDMLFYPWGDVWQQWGSGGYSFAGLPTRDEYNIVDYTRARVFGPNFGRWFSPDPIGKGAVRLDDPQTWNMYAYVRNNPTTLTDPTGLEEKKDPCAEGNSGCEAKWRQSGKGWTKTRIKLHTNAGTVHLTVYTRAGTDWGGKGMTIYAQPDNCANCGWVQTVKPANTFKLFGDFGEHTDWNPDAGAGKRYPIPVLSTGRSMDELYDSPAIGEGGKQFLSTLGTVQQDSSSFGVLGSLSWGAGLINGGVNVQTPLQATPSEQSTSLGIIAGENPTINIQPVQ